MKINFLLIFVALSILFNSNAQLKVLPSGSVGIATNNPIGTLNVNGTFYLTGSGNTFRFFPNNPGTEIGASTDVIDFWYTSTAYNKLNAEQYNKISDSTLKTNIIPLKNGIEKIMALKPYSYEVKTGPENQIISRLEYGFLSQEVNKNFPHITSLSKGLMLMDYDQIIPILVEATKEQQIIIDSLSQEIKSLNRVVNSINNNSRETNILYQNNPNPFNVATTIRYDIDESQFRNAAILVFDLNGVLLKTYKIEKSGKSEITINANDLRPGMFIYTLVVNDKEMDTKKMILIEQ